MRREWFDSSVVKVQQQEADEVQGAGRPSGVVGILKETATELPLNFRADGAPRNQQPMDPVVLPLP